MACSERLISSSMATDTGLDLGEFVVRLAFIEKPVSVEQT
jgi:hypothetical protein